MNSAKRTAAIRKIRTWRERELLRAGVKPEVAAKRVTRDLAVNGVTEWSGKKLRAVARVC